MPIRHFEIFTAERRLIQTSAVSQLKDTRLGIEGNDWLRKILSKETATTAMGGLPLRLTETIERELQGFKQHGIQPIFIFPGLSILRKDKPFSHEDSRPSQRATGWDFYDKKKVDLAMNSWSSGAIHPPDLLNVVFHILNKNNVEFIRAPYSAWAQLIYMYTHPKQLVNAVCGGSELLMWNIERLITSVDFEKGNYHWINKRTVLQDLHVSDEQFLDICLLAGFEYCPTFPPLNTPVVSFTFKGVHDLVKQHKTGFNAVQAYSDNPVVTKIHYIDTYCRTRCAIKYHLVLTDEGQVRPLNAEHAPNDIHELVGYRLPDELYYYLMRGLIGPQSVNSLVSGVLIESAPLDNGESHEYRQFLGDLLEMRTQTLTLLTQPLHQFYKTRKVATHFWFDPHVEQTMHHQPEGSERDNTWNVTMGFIQDELKKQKRDTVDLKFCIQAVGNTQNASKTITKPQEKLLEDKNEILANTLWRTLEIRDIVDANKHTQTVWGKAFALTKQTSYQEAMLTALELIRFNVLTNKNYSKVYSANTQPNMVLVTRVFSLLAMQLKSAPWSGPFNRDLLVFNSFVKALGRSYRNLCEMFALSLFMNGLAKKDRSDYFEIADSLPFMSDVNVALGLVAQHYLESRASGQSAQDALLSTEKSFPTCVSVKSDLERGFQFWNNLMEAVQLLSDAGAMDKSVLPMFIDADQWLQEKAL